MIERRRRAAANSGFKKLAVQWLIEHLCFVSSGVLADSFVLRNRQLLKPAKRYRSKEKGYNMKSPIYSLLLIVSFWSCLGKENTTYKEGLLKCQEDTKVRQTQSPNGMAINRRECIIGCKIPELSSQTITGKIVDKNYFKGKSGIINFWFEGCPACVKEIPDLNDLVDKFGREDFYYLAIGRDSKEDIISFLEDHPWKFDQIVNGSDLLYDKFENIWGYPTTLVVDKNGVIVYSVGRIFENNKQEIIESIQTLLN